MLLFATVISIGAWAQYDFSKASITGVHSQLLKGAENSYSFKYTVILTDYYDLEATENEDYTVSITYGDLKGDPVKDKKIDKVDNTLTVKMGMDYYLATYALTITPKSPNFGGDKTVYFSVVRFEGVGPYTISDTKDLKLLADCVNGGITFKDEYFKLSSDLIYKDSEEHTIIGGWGVDPKIPMDFCGTFDGDGHTIKGIRVNITSDNGYVGLFGRLGSGAVVKNLTLDDANITGPECTGGIAGINYGGKITNCHVTKYVIINTNDENSSYHGGIAGQNGGNDVNGEISYCTSAAQLTVKSGITSWDFYGGIVGQNRSGSTLDHNLVIDAVLPIPTTTDEKCGAITGSNDPGNDPGKTSGILNYNYYDDCTLGIVGIGDNSSDVTNQAEPATILTDTKGLRLPTSLSGKVVYFRAFRYGEPSTIILPFVPNRTENVDKFYTFKGVEKDGNYYKAIMEESTSLNYNTPYIYKAVKPNNETENFRLYFDCYDLESSASDVQEAGSTKPAEDTHWTFKGSYSEILWEALPSGQKRNVYGFAGQAVSDTEDSSKSIEAGEFVRIGEYVRLRPQRCYMEYTPTSSTRAGSLTDEELPETIRVILVDDGGKTDIGSLSPKTGIITFDSDAWYSLDGKRFSTQPAQKGIYVNNGKKVVIK